MAKLMQAFRMALGIRTTRCGYSYQWQSYAEF